MAGPAPAAANDATESRFLDAAEALLIRVGYAGVTTRKLAEEAGANQGLIHYYFGSMEELFLRVLERFTDKLIERQRAMYASAEKYPDKWREAMHYLDTDRPYQKIWWELQAMSWNRPQFQTRVAKVHTAWCDAMREAVAAAVSRYSLERSGLSPDAWTALIATVNEGIILERLAGINRGHDELLAAIQHWLDGMEQKAARDDPP